MISEREQFEVTSTVVGEKVAMSIDPDSMSHIMNVLTDLYSNKRRAIVREYSTNAWDAHVEAGVTRPIEVTLPNTWSPFLKIKDFGVGLTAQDIGVIYSQYGASTKRGSNAQNGMLGLGCKSALTYCSAFTVTSVKDGTKIIVSVGRDEDGSGSMDILDPIPTSEGNGTEVTIPIETGDVRHIIREAEDFFSVWPSGTVLVNGEEPQRFEGLKVSDGIYVVDDRRDSRVVMGNVAYPCPALDGLVNNGSVLAFVPIGSVNFPPSREALMETKQTKSTVETLRSDFQRYVRTAIQNEVTAAPTPADAIKIVIRWAAKVRSSVVATDYSYQGVTLPAAWQIPGYDTSLGQYHPQQPALAKVSQVNAHRKSYHTEHSSIPVGEWPTTVWVTDFAPLKYTAQHKSKMMKWCVQQGLETGRYNVNQDVQQFVCIQAGEAPDSIFVDKSRIVSWDVVKKIQLQPRATRLGTTRVPGSYNVYTETGHKDGLPGDSIRQNHPIYWIHGNEWEGRRFYECFKEHVAHFTLVCLPANRVDKFCRVLPKAMNAKPAAQNIADKWVKSLTSDQKLWFTIHTEHAADEFDSLDPNKINDPDLKNAIKVSKMDLSVKWDQRKSLRYVSSTIGVTLDDWVNPLHKYVLWNDGDAMTIDSEAVYRYLNSEYAYLSK